MIEPTAEMRRAYEEAAAAEWGWLTARSSIAGLAAVLAIVERDHRVEPRPPWEKVVHLATRGDWHLHCCGMDIGEIVDADRITLNPHGVTCKGPTP